MPARGAAVRGDRDAAKVLAEGVRAIVDVLLMVTRTYKRMTYAQRPNLRLMAFV